MQRRRARYHSRMIIALLAAATAGAAQPPSVSILERFVGSCWAADFTPTLRDTHCFENVYGGEHIRDRHEVTENGKTVYAGETIYSNDGPSAVFTYINSMGGVGRGTFNLDGVAIRFQGSMRGSPHAAPQPIDSKWRVIDPDHYEVRSLLPAASRGTNPVLRFSRIK